MDTSPTPVITVLEWVPELARGLVRDIKVRWALEEVGQPYEVEKLPAFDAKPADYLARQPFGQVPAFREGNLDLFETGAILLYLAERHPALLPSSEAGRWKALCWMFASLNSIEPLITTRQVIHFRMGDKPWVDEARAPVDDFLRQRLEMVAQALGGGEWLSDRFSIADITMALALDSLRSSPLVGKFPTLAAYLARAKERPAYQRALQAQLDDFTGDAPDPA